MKVIVTKSYYEVLAKNFPEIEFYLTTEECIEADAIIGEPSDINVEFLDKHPNLRWVQSIRAGYDNIDMNYIRKRNIIFTNGKDIYSVPIAEDVVCKILMHNTNAIKYLENKRNKEWNFVKNRREFYGQTVGIIGTGSIATEIAKRLQGFGVKLLGYKRNPVSTMAYFDEIYDGKKGLEYVLSNSDYIIITVDLNKGTFHMINKDNLKLLKKSASIINIARGSIINQQDLTEALRNNDISYAGLDVFETEPLPLEDELWNFENVYITPHASGVVINNKDRINELVVGNVRRFMNNEPLAYIVK